jgi:hypothetical protein
MLSEADTTGEVRRYLTRTDRAEYGDLPARVVFDRAVGRMVDDMPGFMHSIFDHDDDVIGHVDEGPDRSFVVYRTVERLSGAVPEVRVMETVRTPTGWRVQWGDELEVLEAALRGVPRTRRPPPPPRYGTGGPREVELLMTKEALERELQGLRLDVAREVVRPMSEGLVHHGDSAVVQLLGIKDR